MRSNFFKDYDIIGDGTDNFPTRYLVNDACVLLGKPNVYGSIFRFEGQVTVFGMPDGPCYRCLYPEPPPPGLVAFVRGRRRPRRASGHHRLAASDGDDQADSWPRRFAPRPPGALRRPCHEIPRIEAAKECRCPMCGTNRTIHKLIDYNEFCGIRGEEEPESNLQVPEITPRELKQRLDRGDDLFILDVREPHEYQICNLNGHLIPLGELPRRVHELDSSHEIVAHCRSGKRSAEAVDFLRKAGFRKIHNLHGGILAWSTEVDPSVPRY